MLETLWKDIKSLIFLKRESLSPKKRTRYQLLWEKKFLYADLKASRKHDTRELEERREELAYLEKKLIKSASDLKFTVKLLSQDPLQLSYYVQYCHLNDDIMAHRISSLRSEIKLLEKREKFFQLQDPILRPTLLEEKELDNYPSLKVFRGDGDTHD